MPEKNQRYRIAEAAEIPRGSRRIVEVAGKSIGVFNLDGEFVAWLNVCPHELAPVCAGRVRGTNLPSAPGEFIWGRSGEILACPWHGWEFDLRTGQCLTDPRRLKRYTVEVDEGIVYIVI